MLHGILDLPACESLTISKISIFEIFRTPFAVNLAVLGVLLVWWVRQQQVRAVLSGFSVVLLFLFTGIPFSLGVLGACVAIFVLSRLLASWARRSGSAKTPLITGWVVINGMFLPCFMVVLPPFGSHMEWGEVTQFWGVAFLTLKALHYVGQVCRGHLDPCETLSFRRFLMYMIHIPSFRLGPYQTYRQFTFEIETCKDRVNWRNVGRGLLRIGIGVVKHLIVFHWIQRAFFYPHGYYGPFSTALFEEAATMPVAQVWLMAYLWALRFYLFMSGFSDGVIGMNLMMGIRVPENFRSPFLATTMIEFWRRWHCSVATWLRDEIFIPLGGERRHGSLNYFLTFAYCGFWHWPFLWPTMVLFPLLQVIVFSLTHAWQRFWECRRKDGSRVYQLARRWWLIDSLPSKVAGAGVAISVFVLSCLLLFDHRSSGLPMIARMVGWQDRPAITNTNHVSSEEIATHERLLR